MQDVLLSISNSVAQFYKRIIDPRDVSLQRSERVGRKTT
jgi:hypothetical protein